MIVYIVVKKHWYRDEDGNGQDIGWHSNLCENVKVFRNRRDAEIYAGRLNENLRANAKPYDDLYDYYRFCVGVEVVE